MLVNRSKISLEDGANVLKLVCVNGCTTRQIYFKTWNMGFKWVCSLIHELDLHQASKKESIARYTIHTWFSSSYLLPQSVPFSFHWLSFLGRMYVPCT